MKSSSSSRSTKTGTQTGGGQMTSDSDDQEHIIYDKFGLEINELVERLTMILLDLMKLSNLAGDSDLAAELHLSIANSYSSVPAIRLRWMEFLYRRNMKKNQTLEAAMVRLHQCAYVAELLTRKNRLEKKKTLHLPQGCADFEVLSSTVLEEKIQDSSLAAETTPDITDRVLVNLMEETADLFYSAELYEVAFHLKVMLLPYYENTGDIEVLHNVFSSLRDISQRISAVNNSLLCSWIEPLPDGSTALTTSSTPSKAGKALICRCQAVATHSCPSCGWYCERHMAAVHKALAQVPLCLQGPYADQGLGHTEETKTRVLDWYYLVALYGQVFEDLNGREFVIRESQATRLSHLQDKLLKKYRQLYAAHFAVSGGDISILRDGHSEPETLMADAKNGYVQFTQVKPYFGGSGSEGRTDKLLEDAREGNQRIEGSVVHDRETKFEQNYDVSVFFYDSPFTDDPNHHQTEDTTRQWKRRTFVYTEHAFPYVKQRLFVLRRQSIDLDPLSCVIETVDGQTQRVLTELANVADQASGPRAARLERRLAHVENDSAEAAHLRSEISHAAQSRSLGAMFATPNGAQMMGGGGGGDDMADKMLGARGQGLIAKIKPDVRQLQQILQGSCCVMVMQGATNGIAKAFLETTVQRWPRARLERLIAAMDGLLDALQTAVKVHERYCPQEVLPMHKEIQNGYRAMKADINRMVEAARKIWESSSSPGVSSQSPESPCDKEDEEPAEKHERKVPVGKKTNTAPLRPSPQKDEKEKLMADEEKEESLASLRASSRKSKKKLL